MARKINMLHVKKHLEHVQQVIEGLEKYGLVPVVIDNMKQCAYINKAILRKHAAKKTRKDIYIEARP